MSLIRKNRDKVLPALSLLLLAFCFGLTIRTAWFATTILDGDASSEMVLASILHRTGGLFSRSWVYSTEIRGFYCTQFYRIFFNFFSDWHTVRFAGTVTYLIAYLASWGYLAKQLRAGIVDFSLGGSMLLLPFSVVYGRIVLFHGYYVCYAMLGFWLVALNLALWRDSKTLPRVLHGLGLLLIAFIGGISGVRMMLTAIAPMLCAAVVSAIRFRDDTRPALKQWVDLIKHLIPGGIAVVGFGGGYLINSKVLSRICQFSDYSSTWLKERVASTTPWMLTDFFVDFGYDWDREMISVQGVLSILSVLAGLALLGLAFYVMFSKKSAVEEQYLAGVALFAILIIYLCFLLTFNTTEDYHYCLHMLPSILWLVPMPAVLIGRACSEGRIVPDGKTLFSLFCAAVLGCNGLVVSRFFTDPESWKLHYKGLAFDDTQAADKLRGATEYLAANGYTYGAAVHWYANSVTELSNGQIDMVAVLPAKDRAILQYWLVDSSKLATDLEARAFLLLDNAWAEQMHDFLEEKNLPIVYHDENTTVFSFESKRDLMKLIGVAVPDE